MAMLLPVAVSPPTRAIQARHHKAIVKFAGFRDVIEPTIHFLTGGITMKANASQYCHVVMGIAWYHAKGCRNHITISKQKIRVASFHRLNRTRPLINAATVGVKNVSGPRKVALGFTNRTSHPKTNPETHPQKIPKIAAVKAENIMLEKVMYAVDPRIG